VKHVESARNALKGKTKGRGGILREKPKETMGEGKEEIKKMEKLT